MADKPVRVGDILRSFHTKHGIDIGTLKIKELITESKKEGLHETVGAKELAKDMLRLVNSLLINEGVPILGEAKEAAKHIGNVFSHT